MGLEKMVRVIAGVLTLISVTLGYFVHPGWNFFTVFIGFNLLQSPFTGWCMMEIMLTRLGVQKKCILQEEITDAA